MAHKRNFWLGMVIGAAAGAISALMYAPKSGEEMRRDVKAKAREAGRKAGEAWSSLTESSASVAQSARERARQVIGKGQETVKTYRERVGEAMKAGKQAAEEKRKELEAELEAKQKATSKE